MPLRRCPHCQSHYVRRSSFHRRGESWFGVFSPYHCRNCNKYFRVVSEKFHVVAVVIGSAAAIVILLLIVAMFVGTVSESFTSPNAEKRGEAVERGEGGGERLAMTRNEKARARRA